MLLAVLLTLDRNLAPIALLRKAASGMDDLSLMAGKLQEGTLDSTVTELTSMLKLSLDHKQQFPEFVGKRAGFDRDTNVLLGQWSKGIGSLVAVSEKLHVIDTFLEKYRALPACIDKWEFEDVPRLMATTLDEEATKLDKEVDSLIETFHTTLTVAKRTAEAATFATKEDFARIVNVRDVCNMYVGKIGEAGILAMSLCLIIATQKGDAALAWRWRQRIPPPRPWLEWGFLGSI